MDTNRKDLQTEKTIMQQNARQEKTAKKKKEYLTFKEQVRLTEASCGPCHYNHCYDMERMSDI